MRRPRGAGGGADHRPDHRRSRLTVAKRFEILKRRSSGNALLTADDLVSVGRVTTGASWPQTEPDPSLQGKYSGGRAFMFDSAYHTQTKVDDQRKRFEYVATHEIAHAAFGPYLSRFIKAFPYWKDASTHLDETEIQDAEGKDPTKKIERPCTVYSSEGAKEDLAESAALFFVQPAKLAANCPQRYAFIQRLVDEGPSIPMNRTSAGVPNQVPGPKP